MTTITETPSAPDVAGAPVEALIEEARRRRHRRWAVILAVVVVAASGAAVLWHGSGGGVRTVRRLPPPTARPASDAYPVRACRSSQPTSLLLPARDLANARLSPGPAWAAGGEPLDPFGLPEPGRSGPRSAAVVTEQLLDVRAPRTAVQNADPYNAAHPDSITTFDETVSGFTDPQAEATFYSRGLPQHPPPDGSVDGRPVREDVGGGVNLRGFPAPNEVTSYALPSTDTPGVVEVTIRSGETVIGFNFEGGSRLSVARVAPIVTAALGILAAACHGTDVMAPAWQ